ncbi:hypothetical protein CsSME_00047292 [Camellia sinensis var. sinensis]
MDSNQSTSHFSNSSSPSSGSSSIDISPPFDSQIDTFVKTNAFNSDSKPINSNTSIRSSSSDDGGFVSGDEEFETVSEKPVVVNPDEETPEKVVEGVDIRDPVLGSPEFYTPMPVAVAMPVDDVEKFPKARVLWGEEVEKDGVVDGMGSNSTVGDGVTDSIPFDAMESFEEKPEILVEMLGEKSNLNESIEEGGFGVTHDGSVEVLTGCNGDKVADTSKLDEVVVSSEVGESLVLDGEKVEEEKKSEALNGEESSVLSPDSNQLEDKIVEPVNSELAGEDGVKFTTNGDSVVESIRVNLSEPGAAVVGETEVSKDQVNPAVVSGGFVNGSDDKISHDVEKADDSDVVKVNTDFENNIETSTNRSVEVEESEPLGEQEADSKAVVKISADGGELVSSNEVVGADRDGLQGVDFVDDSTLSNPAQEAKHLDLDGAQDDGLEEEFSDESGLIQNSQVLLEAEDEGKNHTDEGGNIGGSFSDGETDGMIFGSSEAAKQFIEELERGAGAGSHSGAESSYDQQQRIDGQIVIDSDEEADTDEEGEGKELFDSAALAALLKAATGGGSDDGNITITSQDGSRLFSIERPAGLGSSIRPSKPATRPNRSSLFTPTGLTTGGESENSLSEEDKKKLEKLQLIRVKFLRLVQRLGASPDESVASQVLYRIALIAGRQTGQTFSLDDAKGTAMQLEAEGKDDLDFSVNILVLGKSGVGKSATINSIFGEEKALIDAFEPATMNVKEISGTVDGVKIKVFDTPGLKSAVMEQAFNRRVLSSIKKFTKKSPPDIVLYVDRLDTQTRDLNDLPLLKMITSSLGPSIWRSAIVTLTHAASAPPDGPSGSPLSYEVFVTQRSHVVQQSIGHAVGDLRMMSPSLMNPVSLVENHPLCRKNREGQKVLPNGQTWRPQLLLLCYSMKILSEASFLSKPQDPFDHRKLFGFRVRSPPLPYMLSSMLQTRAHPKLPSDQGIENGDSDIDLADLSDSDQEEEEDEYDQLPPFKPLRKSQLAKLSKEQRKAYFEEYDYRVKLLQKKQWREELKRMREMKKKGNDATANDYDFVGEDADQENGSAAPVSTPLPDMVLPPSFDSDSPAYRYRFLEPTSQFLARPVLDTHGWDHDCGYDGVNLEQSLAIASQFPAAISLQITKDKKDFSIHLDSSVSAKHGENGSSMAGFDIQTIGKQLAYIVRGETKFKNLKKNKTAAGFSITFLGENIATGLKVEDQIVLGKQWALVGSAGTVRCQGDAAYGANFELQRRELDYPIGQVQSTYGLSLIKWRGDWALGFNTVAQFSMGRSSKVALRAGINNKLSGQITIRTSSSEHLSIALASIIPIATAVYKKLWPAVGENYSIY